MSQITTNEWIRRYREQTGFTGPDWDAFENAKIYWSDDIKNGFINPNNPYNKEYSPNLNEPTQDSNNISFKAKEEELNYDEIVKESSPTVMQRILSFTPMGQIADGQITNYLSKFGTYQQRRDIATGKQAFVGSDDYEKYAQRKYNESMAGQAWTYLYGKPKYDVDEYDDDGMVVETAGTILGMLNPVDIAAFVATGVFGRAIQGAVGLSPALKQMVTRGATKLIPKSAGKYGSPALNKYLNRYIATEAGVDGFVNMTTFGAAQSALHSAAQQSQRVGLGLQDEIDYKKVAYDAAGGGLKSGALGAAAGYVARGKMAPIFAKSKMKNDPKFADTVNKLLTNPAGQVLAEGAVFGTGHYGLDYLPRVLNGEINPKTGKPYSWSFKDWARTVFESSAVIGAIRASTKPMRRNQGDVERFLKHEKEFYKGILTPHYANAAASYNLRFGDSKKTINEKIPAQKELVPTETGKFYSEYQNLKNIEKTFQDANMPTPKEVIEKIFEYETLAESKILGAEALNTKIKNFNDLLKSVGIKKSKKLSDDQMAKILQDLPAINAALYDMYSTMKSNPGLAYEVFKGQIKDPLSKNRELEIDKLIDVKMRELEDITMMLNGGALNNPAASKLQQAKYADGFAVETREMKNGQFELILRTPEDSKILLPNALKIHSSKQSAEKFGNALKQRYRERLIGADSKPSEVLGNVEPEVSIVATNKQGIPLVDAQNNPRISRVLKSEAEKLISEGKAKYPKDVNLDGGTNLNAESVNIKDPFQKRVLEFVEGREAEARASKTIENAPIKQTDYDVIAGRANQIIDKAIDKSLMSKSEKEFAKMLEFKGKDAPVRDLTKDLTGVNRTVLFDFADKHFKNVLLSGKQIGTNRYQVNDVVKFLSDISKKNKDVPNIDIMDVAAYFDKYRTAAPSTKRATSISGFADFIRGDYLKNAPGKEIQKYIKKLFNETNEYINESKFPVKEKLRRKSIELAIRTNDIGIEIAAKIGARFALRPGELNNLSKAINEKGLLEKIKLDKSTNEYYMDLKLRDGTAKSGARPTFDRVVFIDKALYNQIESYINSGGSLKGKQTKVGQLIKNDKEISSGNKNHFYDYRKRMKDVGGFLNTVDQSVMDYMLGNNKNRLDAIYRQMNPSKHIELQKELHKKLNTPFEDVAPTKDNLGGLEVGSGPFTPQNMRILRKGLIETGKFAYNDLPKFMINSGKKLGITKDNFIETYKSIESGAKNVSNSVVNWYKAAVNYMGKTITNAGKSVRDYIKDYVENPKMGLSIDLVKDPAKIKNIKNFANGTKRDIRLLSNEYGLKPKELIDMAASSSGIDDIPAFRKFLYNPPEVNNRGYNTFKSNLIEFQSSLEGLDLKSLKGQRNLYENYKLIGEIEKERKFINFISDQKQTELLKLLGVKEGNINKATNEQLQEYKSFLREREPEGKVTEYITNDEINLMTSKLNYPGKKYLEPLVDMAVMTTLPSERIAKIFGFPKISEKIKSHYALEEQFLGKGLSFFNKDVMRESGSLLKDIGTGTIAKDLKGEKFKNNLYFVSGKGENMVDHLQWLRSGEKLPRGENKRIREGKKFFDKAIDKKWWKTVKYYKDNPMMGKGDALNKKKNNKYIYINENTPEGRVVLSYMKNIVDFYGKNNYETALKRQLNESEYQDALNQIKWINDGIYITRQHTSDALNIMGKTGSAAQEKVLNKMALDIAVGRAKEKFGSQLSTKELKEKIYDGKPGETLIETSKMIAEDKLFSSFEFNPNKLDIKYVKERFSKQDAYVKDERGKLYTTYKHKWSETGIPYAQGMSKYLATISVAPDVVKGLRPNSNINKIFDTKELGLTLQTDIDKAKIVKQIVERQFGMETGNPIVNKLAPLGNFAGGIARFTVKGKLSFGPVSGVNNLIYATAFRAHAFKAQHIAKGLLDIIRDNSALTKNARRSGAYDIGKALYEGTGRVDKYMDLTLLKTSLIKPTESFNRIWDIAASKYDQREQFNKLRLYPKEHKNYKEAFDGLKDRYFLTDNEINFRKKYNTVEDIKVDTKFNTEFERAKAITKWNDINGKMNVYAHTNVQGSSNPAFQPFMAGNRLTKPLMAFMSMAYVNTTRTVDLTKHAIKHKSFVKPVMGLTANVGAGYVRYKLYQTMFNAAVPDEYEIYPVKYLTNLLWYGGYGGMLSDWIPGYGPYRNVGDKFHPAIVETFTSIYDEIQYMIEGKKDFFEAGETIASKNIALYGRSKQIFERTDNPFAKNKFNGDRLKINKYKSKFKENFNKKVYATDGKRKGYNDLIYDNLKDSFYLGTKEEFGDALVASALELATQHYGQTRGIIPKEIEKFSQSKIDTLQMKKSWKRGLELVLSKQKTLNPIYPYHFSKKTNEGLENSQKFFFYTAGLIDKDGNPTGVENEDEIKQWVRSGGQGENPMKGVQLKIWNELRDAEKRFIERRDEYFGKTPAELKEIIESRFKDPDMNGSVVDTLFKLLQE